MPDIQLDSEDTREVIDPVEDLQYEPIERKYRTVQIVLTMFVYAIFAGIALLLLLLDDCVWCIVAECVIVIALAINLVIVRKAWLFKGYALSEFDISFRSGIVFPSVTTIPFNRLQQISIKQDPVSKLIDLYSVEVVNGAQGLASMIIPGLTKERAEQIKRIVIEKLKNEQG